MVVAWKSGINSQQKHYYGVFSETVMDYSVILSAVVIIDIPPGAQAKFLGGDKQMKFLGGDKQANLIG